MDANHHVNNAAYVDLVQSGRVAFLRGLIAEANEDGSWVVARLTIDYLNEVRFPAKVDIGSAVLGIGRSSCTVIQGLFKEDTCAAVVETVMVRLSPERVPIAISAPLRARLEGFSLL